jgi:hypothetical protein
MRALKKFMAGQRKTLTREFISRPGPRMESCHHFIKVFEEIFCLSLLVLAMTWTIGPTPNATAAAIVFYNEAGRDISCLPFEPGVPIHLYFINSIYQAPVRETFTYEPGHGLILNQVESPSAGVFEYYGLEHNSSGVAQIRRKVGEIRILSSDYENHAITVGQRSIRLKGLVSDGEPVLLKVEEGMRCMSP